MDELMFISCVRFSLQLMICEAAFLTGRPRRKQFSWRLAGALAAHFVCAFFWNELVKALPGGPLPARILLWAGLFAFTLGGIWCCFDLISIELLFVGTGGYATEHIAFALGKILQYAGGWSEESLGVFLHTFLFRSLIYVLISGLMYVSLIRPNRGKGDFKPGDGRIALLALVMLMAAIVLSVFYSYDAFMEQGTVASEVVCPLYGMLCCTLVLLMEFYVLRENRMEREREVMDQLLQVANAQRRTSQETIDIINMKCHDLKHQIQALAAMDDTAARSRYIAEVQQAVSIYDADYHTGCEALDYVLREKALLAGRHHVTFSCMADGGAIAFMDPADIYALMGNALDNALEQVSKESEEERLVSLFIKRAGDMVLLHLENRCSRPPEFQDGLPLTDKEDKTAHGFGVRSIRYLVKRYHGEALMQAADGTFCLDILLPLQRATT